ncbi:MAG: hypothetical protein A3E87_04045 [Gammaproteobacteria bacterium RIFCSPHIGHO2_12_FULL_35_23]|nr:MAG: hypothetical protein A3E87_04045 [Gammaproteobacteria bacterium RIFCSPHIGHO2_12_FULL_35_23]
MIKFFILLQFCLLFFMLFHDWIPVPPLNDTVALKKVDGNWDRLKSSLINGACVAIPLWLTLKYVDATIPLSTIITILAFYLALTIGTICAWWIPYFFGSSEKHKQIFKKFKNTHHFLPARGNNIIPNTLHVLLHLQIWTCLLFSVYFLFFR